MESKYRHTQYGGLTLVVFLTTGILIAVLSRGMFADGRSLPAVLMLLIYFIMLVLFYSLTIEVTDEKLKFWFGIGILRKTIPIEEIQSTDIVQNPWYYFWGIKAIPGGWLYAIAPGPAVIILLKDGRFLHLGSDQPAKLRQAISSNKVQKSSK